MKITWHGAGTVDWHGNVQAWAPGAEIVIDNQDTAAVKWARAHTEAGNATLVEDAKDAKKAQAKAPPAAATATAGGTSRE